MLSNITFMYYWQKKPTIEGKLEEIKLAVDHKPCRGHSKYVEDGTLVKWVQTELFELTVW